MKKIILFFSMAIFAMGSNSQSVDYSYVENDAFAKVSNINEQPFYTNAKAVLSEIVVLLNEKIEMPELCQQFYNEDVTIIASFSISKNGQIENIAVGDGAHKMLEKVIEKELTKLGQVTPVLENGMPVKRNFKIPVVFKI